MRILHFHPDGKMARQFVQPLIVAETSSGFESKLVVDRNPLGGVACIPYDIRVARLAYIPLTIFRILYLLWKFCPDVIVSHNTRSSFIPLLLAKMVGIRHRVYFNHGVPYIAYHGPARWILRILENANCMLSTNVLTVSKDMVEILNLTLYKSDARYIHNGSASGIEIGDFVADRYDRLKWRKNYGLKSNDLIVVFVGRPERRKGFELVLRLWGENFVDKDITLVLCGPSVKDVILTLGTKPKNVIALGFVENVPEVLASSDMLVLPSLHEGLSYACIEAQASGMLVIANDVPGVRCVIDSGVNGFLVKDNAINMYAEIIQRVYNDYHDFDDIRRQARLSAERFSREKFMHAYIDFLKKIISN